MLCQILYARTRATTYLPFFAILSFTIQEPSSPFISVILRILFIAILARLIRKLKALLVSLKTQSLPLFKGILRPLKHREEGS